jgi:hypothetical protein
MTDCARYRTECKVTKVAIPISLIAAGKPIKPAVRVGGYGEVSPRSSPHLTRVGRGCDGLDAGAMFRLEREA